MFHTCHSWDFGVSHLSSLFPMCKGKSSSCSPTKSLHSQHNSTLFPAALVFQTVAVSCACKIISTAEAFTDRKMEIISGSLLIEITELYRVFTPTTVLQKKKKFPLSGRHKIISVRNGKWRWKYVLDHPFLSYVSTIIFLYTILSRILSSSK